jgi:hypothetical protein
VHYFVNTTITATCMPVEVYMLYKFVSDLSVVFTRYSDFLHQTGFSEKNEILLKMAINQTKNKRKLSPTLGCVMGPIFTSLSNDIFHVFSPVVSYPLQCSVRSSLLPFIVFLGLALFVFFWIFPYAVVTILLANDVRVV